MLSKAIHNETDLLQKIAKGDTQAFSQLFHDYNARLLPFVKKIIKSETIAEEIAQEVFLRVWINREKLAEMENPGAWIFLIASNLSFTHLPVFLMPLLLLNPDWQKQYFTKRLFCAETTSIISPEISSKFPRSSYPASD